MKTDSYDCASLSTCIHTWGYNKVTNIFFFGQIYKNLSPVLERKNVIVRNRMVPSSVEMVQTSLTQQPDFFVRMGPKLIVLSSFYLGLLLYLLH